MPVITIGSGRRFTAGVGESLLDAALRAGVTLAHGCRTGRCSQCRARMPSGSSVVLRDEVGLSGAERSDGWILACARAATSDATLEATDLGDVQLHPARTWPCRIDALQLLAPDVLGVTLRLPPSSGFDFRAGQYIDLVGPGGLRRSYSMANAPRADKRIELHIRRVAGGAMSRYWFEQARVDDLLRLHGPQGTSVLRDLAGLSLVFLATGTGIAPVKAMLEALAGMAPAERPAATTVYWGGRQAGDLYWQPPRMDPALRFVPVLSRAGADWAGSRGHVQHALLAAAPDLSRTVVHACGSDVMVEGARRALVGAGLPPHRFHADAFVCSAPA